MSQRTIRRWGMTFGAACTLCGGASGATWRVDASAPPGGDGQSWATAFQRVQDALAVAGANDEVRIAQGVYKPGAPGASRESTFAVPNAVTLLGGFAGLSGAMPDARDPSLFVTTLSGDLNADDAPVFLNRADNAFHVVTAVGITTLATLDGVRVAGGASNGAVTPNFFDRGAAVFARAQSGFGTVARIRLIGCLIQDNSGSNASGVGTYDINLRADRCAFADNSATNGPAGFSDTTLLATPHRFDFVGCVFERNAGGGFGGGAIRTMGVGYTLSLSGCRFSDNTSSAGAGVYTGGTGNFARAINCVFDGNTALSGPAWFDDNTATLHLINCTMTRNTATFTSGVGSVVRLLGVNSLIANTIIHGNTAPDGAITGFNMLVARNSNIQGGFAGAGNISADPLFRDAPGGDYRLRRASPSVDRGVNADVLADEFDLDADGNTTEPTPLDLTGAARFVDDPASEPNGGASVADMGALERQVCPGDATDDLIVNFADLNVVLSQFGQSGAIGALTGDVTGDGAVSFADLNLVLSRFGVGC